MNLTMKLLLSPLQTTESPQGIVLFDLLPRAKDGDEKLRRGNRGRFCPPKHPSRYLVPATHHNPGKDRDLKSQKSDGDYFWRGWREMRVGRASRELSWDQQTSIS